VFTVVDVLHRAEAEQRVLTADQYDFVQRALSRSDDNAMNALWDEFGGSRTITEMIGLANLRDTRPPTDPTSGERPWCPPGTWSASTSTR